MKSEKMSEVEELVEELLNSSFTGMVNEDIEFHISKDLRDRLFFFLKSLQSSEHGELVEELNRIRNKSLDLAKTVPHADLPFGVKQDNPFKDEADTLSKAIAALSAPMTSQYDEWMKACTEAGGLLLAADDSGNISGFEIDQISGGAKYINNFPEGLTLKHYGDDDNYETVRYIQEAPKKFDVLEAIKNTTPIIDEAGNVYEYSEKNNCYLYKNHALGIFGLANRLWQPYKTETTPAELIENARKAVAKVYQGEALDIEKIQKALEALEKLAGEKGE